MTYFFSKAATCQSAYVSLLQYSGSTPFFHSSTRSVSTSRNSNNSPYLYAIRCCSTIHNDSSKQRLENIKSRTFDDPSSDNCISIFDTTLRDGEQAPGASMTPTQKLHIARQLAKLRVDVIEAGFPASSDGDFDIVKLIAREVGNNVDEEGYVPVICGFARCTKRDIERAWEALKYAKKPMIHACIATSDIHLKYKLNMSREQVVEKATSMVAYAWSLGCQDVRFSAEDAARSDKEFLCHILGEVIKAGATSIALPDTVGCNLPGEFAQLVSDIKANTPGIESAIISIHCHNDLGFATANSVAGICAGARQVDVTINGIGERAGNASLEEVVMAIKYHGKQALGGLYTGINTQHIIPTSKMVEEYTGLIVQPNKAIVGANAFAHTSGIHQDGILKNKYTYQILSPEDVGLHRANESGIVLGRLSGRHGLKTKMLELGYDFDEKEFEEFFSRFKSVAEKKKKITDDDLIAIVSDEVFQPQVAWQLGDVKISCGSVGLSTATVKLIDTDGREHTASSAGTGPVDAAFKAVNLILKVRITLLEYSVDPVTEGIDATASTKVLIRWEDDDASIDTSNGQFVNRTVSGTGADVDIVVSVVRACVNALNRLLSYQKSQGIHTAVSI